MKKRVIVPMFKHSKRMFRSEQLLLPVAYSGEFADTPVGLKRCAPITLNGFYGVPNPKVGDTFKFSGIYRPFTRSEAAINGWRRRRHQKLLPRVLKEFTVASVYEGGFRAGPRNPH